MRTPSLPLLYLLFILALQAAAPGHGQRFRAPHPPDPVKLAADIFQATNVARTGQGLPALRREARIDKAAVLFSKYMGEAGFFAHVGPDGVDVRQRIQAQKYEPAFWGENIAWGQTRAREVVDGWMNSPIHRANILNRNYQEIGVGVAIVNGRTFLTQDFATERARRR